VYSTGVCEPESTVCSEERAPRASIIDREMMQVVDGDLVKVRAAHKNGAMRAKWFDRRSAWPRSFPWNRHCLLGSRILGAGDEQASTQIPCDA
jgi:hypothetical protein